MVCLVQVLQQDCVEAESLDEVDSSGKTLLDRLTMPVVFPDGYTHTTTIFYANVSHLGMDCSKGIIRS